MQRIIFNLGLKLETFLVTFLLIFASCAQIVTPNGGKSDSTPPKSKSINPPNNSVNFKSRRIEFVFDEFIQLKDPQKQILISPPLKNFPDLKVKGKKLIIEINDSLQKNSTYTFNFGNSITDITEYNPISNFKYVFSTGNYLDSLKIRGNIVNSFTKKPDDNMLVAIYNEPCNFKDSCAQKKLPNYFTKTNNTGFFEIENIKEGIYSIAAFNDANSNYLYDSEDEVFGFLDSLINIDSAVFAKDLYSFKANPSKLFVKKTNEDLNNLQIIFNKSPNFNLNISTIQKLENNWAQVEKNKLSDTIIVWYSKNTKLLDSLSLIISEGDNALDTIEVNFKKFRNSNTNKGRGARPELKLSISNLFNGKMILPNSNLVLKANMPIVSYDTNRINILHNKDTLPFNLTTLDSLKKSIEFSTKFDSDSTYKIVFLPKAITAINGIENDTLKLEFKIQNITNLGSLKLIINTPDTTNAYIFQFYNEQNILYQEKIIYNTHSFYFEKLQPGKYNLKLVCDSNKNGKWDTGNYNLNIQPEKIYLYNGSINVRPNWDLEEAWDLSKDKITRTKVKK